MLLAKKNYKNSEPVYTRFSYSVPLDFFFTFHAQNRVKIGRAHVYIVENKFGLVSERKIAFETGTSSLLKWKIMKDIEFLTEDDGPFQERSTF